ncbi:MAG: glycosyltransferase family 2 protein [[Clostridium] leptum]
MKEEMYGGRIDMNMPIVSLIIVALNEEKALPNLLEDIKQQGYQHDRMDIVLIDSMSKDQTRTIMKNFMNSHDFYRVTCLENPKMLQAPGWNIGLDTADGEIIMRLDAHASIPEDFIEKNVRCLERGHDICGGKVMNYIPNATIWMTVINMLEDSMFGGSVAAFRRKESAGTVKTLAFAAYRREVFEAVGYFDERLARTEDNEIHYRMRCKGYDFFYDPDICSRRETRPSLRKLTRQKYLNGYWIGLTLKICPKCISLYHLIPFLFVSAVVFSSILAFLGVPQFSLLLWVLYGLFAVVNTVISAVHNGFYIFTLCMPFLFLVLHAAYGVGTLMGLLRKVDF